MEVVETLEDKPRASTRVLQRQEDVGGELVLVYYGCADGVFRVATACSGYQEGGYCCHKGDVVTTLAQYGY
jgi:hypothetical protein